MKITEERDYCLTINKNTMKKSVFFLAAIPVIMFLGGSCKNTPKNQASGPDTSIQAADKGPLLIGKDIITEVVVKPDTLGDPWEVEKVKGFNGKEMFISLFENIKNKNLTVFDCFTGQALSPADVKKMETEIGTDVSRIGKIQFLEDWYYYPLTFSISKKIKSASFGYETIREDGLPTGYKALFKVVIK
jgi:hypothetical protein